MAMRLITSAAELIPDKYYWCRQKGGYGAGNILLLKCGEEDGRKYIGSRMWARSDNDIAFVCFDITGPVLQPSTSDFDELMQRAVARWQREARLHCDNCSCAMPEGCRGEFQAEPSCRLRTGA